MNVANRLIGEMSKPMEFEGKEKLRIFTINHNNDLYMVQFELDIAETVLVSRVLKCDANSSVQEHQILWIARSNNRSLSRSINSIGALPTAQKMLFQAIKAKTDSDNVKQAVKNYRITNVLTDDSVTVFSTKELAYFFGISMQNVCHQMTYRRKQHQELVLKKNGEKFRVEEVAKVPISSVREMEEELCEK